MPTIDAQRSATLQMLSRSGAALALARRGADITGEIRRAKVKVWSVARAARLFGISERLLWKWIAAGCLPKYRRPTVHHRKGITTRALVTFVKQVQTYGEFIEEPRRDRRRRAESKCREVANQLNRGEHLTPRQFASRSRVAVTTVHRLIALGFVDSYRPTEHRLRVCHWSEKYRRKRLTAKKLPNRH